MGTLDTWYDRMSDEDIMRAIDTAARSMERSGKKKMAKNAERGARKTAEKARSHDSLQALSKLAERVDGEYRIVSQPPIVVPLPEVAERIGVQADQLEQLIHEQFRAYRETLEHDRRHLLERFQFVDAARKVVGVGSVGTGAYIVLLQGRDEQDPLFLQVKEATKSVLEDHLPKSRFTHPGERVVARAAADASLQRHLPRLDEGRAGEPLLLLAPAARHEGLGGRRRNAAGDARVLCRAWRGHTLARAHARSGDAIAIAAYLGNKDRFDQSITDFAERYADQNDRDYRAFTKAIKSGRLAALEDV